MQKKVEKNKAMGTSPNRIVNASPPNGGSGLRLARSFHSHASLTHIFAVAKTASQFFYRNSKNVINLERYAT